MSEWKDSEIGQIPVDWEVTTIDDIAEIVTDGAHMSPKLFHGGRYMASVKDMTYDRFDFSECKTISQIDFEVLMNQGCSPREGDILISKDGEKCLDLIFVYNQKEQIVLLSSIAIVRLKEGYNPNFYRYFLLSYVAQTIMYKWFRSGSAIPRVVLRDFKKVPVPLISGKEQDNISSILSNLDQKIALLRQQNQTLEELAQTLFKRWFVEFEFPNENGEPYKSSGGKMVESELGEIPEGWRVSSLGELAENKAKTYKFNGNEVIFINTGDVQEGKFLHKNYSSPTGLPGQAKKAIELNDILYSEIRPRNKRFAFVDFDSSEYVVSTKFMIIKAKGEIYPQLLYLILKQQSSVDKIDFIAESRSGTFPQVTFDSISDFEILRAPMLIQKKFKEFLQPAMQKQKNNEQEIQTLTQLRDTLLPKLMSGELRAKNNYAWKNLK